MSKFFYKQQVENLLDTMPELTGTTREKLLSTKIINSNELGLNDLDIAEALVTDLEEAINLFE